MTDETDLQGEVAEYQAEVRRLRAELAQLRGTGLHAVPDAEPVRRVTNTEVLRAFLDRMRTSATGEHSTVSLKTNAKGDTQVEVSVRTGETEDTATVEDAAAKARTVYDLLRSFYPMGALAAPGRDDG